jgi:hypothetical protein
MKDIINPQIQRCSHQMSDKQFTPGDIRGTRHNPRDVLKCPQYLVFVGSVKRTDAETPVLKEDSMTHSSQDGGQPGSGRATGNHQHGSVKSKEQSLRYKGERNTPVRIAIISNSTNKRCW